MSSYDDIFETDESRAEAQLERVQKIPISELVPFKDHPFKVVDDEAMLRTTESIAQYGVLTPLIARRWKTKPMRSSPVTAESMQHRQPVLRKCRSLSGIWMMTPRLF